MVDSPWLKWQQFVPAVLYRVDSTSCCFGFSASIVLRAPRRLLSISVMNKLAFNHRENGDRIVTCCTMMCIKVGYHNGFWDA